MNGLDFNIRVLRPWARDPAFYASVWTYQSDTPAHEGPTHHALVELWRYSLPLTVAGAERLAGELATIPPLLAQARQNLTGNARELWLAGIDNIRDQAAALEDLEAETGDEGDELDRAIAAARTASLDFVAWLEEQAPSKTGPSGIGKDHYTWYLQNVHLVPLTWEDEVRLLKHELDRAHASLRLEEHRNRDLPPLRAISSDHETAWHGHTAETARAEGGMEFLVPRGANRFHFSGGARFIHGGAMPQEIVVPVVTAKHVRDKKSKESTRPRNVLVQVLGIKHKITAPKHRFQLIQMEPVSDRAKSVTLKVAVYEGSEPVTSIESVTFESQSDSIDERQKWVTLTLQDRQFDKKTPYRLVLRDTDTGIEQLSVDVTIDRAIIDDFDF